MIWLDSRICAKANAELDILLEESEIDRTLRDEDQDMTYAMNCGKPVLNIDLYTLKLCVLK